MNRIIDREMNTHILRAEPDKFQKYESPAKMNSEQAEPENEYVGNNSSIAGNRSE